MRTVFLPLGLAAFLFQPLLLSAQSALAQSNTPGTSITGSRQQEPTGILTLATALKLALEANPDLSVFVREIEAIEATIGQARVLPNPELSASVEDTRKETRTTILQISQPIELGGKRSARIRAAERTRDAASADLASKRAEIRATVVATFHDMLVAQKRVRLAQASLELAQHATTAASRRVTAGKVSPLEETKARVAEAGVRVELNQANSDMANSRKRLAATWGSTSPRFDRVEGSIDGLPQLPGLADLTTRLVQSPQLIRARLEVERRQTLIEVERSRRVPDITVSLGAKRDAELGRNQAMFGVSIPLPIFDHNQGNLREALVRSDKARDELTATEVRLSAELAQAHERLAVARSEIEVMRTDILLGAQSAYDAATKGFELGKFGFLDVLDAQRTLFQAQSQYLRALAEAHRAAAEIERIVGSGEQ